ncbi:hypothetical protein ACSQ67_013660 [Phaseolus vulgaris]
MDESSCSKSCCCLCMKRCLLTPYYYAKWGIHYGVQGSFQLRSTNNLLRKLEKDQSSLQSACYLLNLFYLFVPGIKLHVAEIFIDLALFPILVIGMYLYIPLGGSKKKLLNVWVIFTFVAIWHDLEWKLLSWAWLTCLFFIPELAFKSARKAFQVQSSFGVCIFRELSAVAGAVTITCLMVANLVGFVVGPGGINWLLSSFLHKDGLPVLGGMLATFYIGTKIMFHIDEAKQRLP